MGRWQERRGGTEESIGTEGAGSKIKCGRRKAGVSTATSASCGRSTFVKSGARRFGTTVSVRGDAI